MSRSSSLMLVLGAIIVINVLAIVLLSMRSQAPAPVQVEQIQRAQGPISHPPVQVEAIVFAAPDCPDCFDIRQYADALTDVNLSVRAGDPALLKAAILAQSPPIVGARFPAIAFNESFENYSYLLEGWNRIGYNITLPGEHGLWYVLPTLNPPYETLDGSIKGRVAITYVTMDSCTRCYNVSIHRDFLAEFKIVPSSSQTIDVSSPQGTALLKRYNITQVPTIVLDSGAAEYPQLSGGWNVVGTVEPDGSYVLRDLDKLKVPYYDITKNRLVEP